MSKHRLNSDPEPCASESGNDRTALPWRMMTLSYTPYVDNFWRQMRDHFPLAATSPNATFGINFLIFNTLRTL